MVFSGIISVQIVEHLINVDWDNTQTLTLMHWHCQEWTNLSVPKDRLWPEDMYTWNKSVLSQVGWQWRVFPLLNPTKDGNLPLNWQGEWISEKGSKSDRHTFTCCIYFMLILGWELPDANKRAPCNGWSWRWIQCLSNNFSSFFNKPLFHFVILVFFHQATLDWNLMLIWVLGALAGILTPSYVFRWPRFDLHL